MYAYRKATPEQRRELVKERWARGFPPHSPPHPVRDQALYLLTAACYEHAPYMSSQARRVQVLDMLFEQFNSWPMEIRAWAILPNHYHLLLLVTDFNRLSNIFRLVHGPTSRQWNLEDGQPGRKVWYHFSDRAIRSEAHYYATLNYIHYNPVKHCCVKTPYDWAEFSVHWYLESFGREWLRDTWRSYPVRQYGDKWDDI